MQIEEMEDTRAFLYGFSSDEVDELTDPFYAVAAHEEELGMPLAFIIEGRIPM